MTQAELAARKAAWEAYYQAVAANGTRLAEAERTALAGDAQTSLPSTPAAPGGAPSAPPAADKEGGQGASASESSPSSDYLTNGLTLPISRYEVKAGDIIKFRTLQGLTNETTGTFIAIVTAPVFDAATGMHILIPQGSRLFGTYDNQQVNGDERLPAAITRIKFPAPGNQSLDLTRMAAADQSGYGGFHDQVDNHTLRLLLNAVVLGAFGAATQLSQPQSSNSQYGNGYSSQQVIAGSLGQQLGQVGAAYAQKGLNVKPTLTIRPGYSGVLQMTKDIAFAHPWQPSTGPITALSGDVP